MELYGISKDQIFLFNNGEDYESYNIFGAHHIEYQGKKGVRFLVYAPYAIKVFEKHKENKTLTISLTEDTRER